jgi:hypothetical protein
MNGVLEHWNVTGVGNATGRIHARFRPSLFPLINWTLFADNGCTATPIRDCNVSQTTGNSLAASFFISVDETLGDKLAGAVFATTGAIHGNLIVTDEPPTLEYQLSSAHFQADGETLQIGSMRAILPSASVEMFFRNVTNTSAGLHVERRGAGTQDSINISKWTAGMDATVIDITGVTFSAPTYVVSLVGSSSTSTPSWVIPTAASIGAVAFILFLIVVYRCRARCRRGYRPSSTRPPSPLANGRMLDSL